MFLATVNWNRPGRARKGVETATGRAAGLCSLRTTTAGPSTRVGGLGADSDDGG